MKKIGGCIYAHYTMYDEKLDVELVNMIDDAISILFDEGVGSHLLSTEIYKIDLKNNTVSFIESKDWDKAREPQVGDAYNVNLTTKEIKFIKSKGQIYHHKWMFVADDYNGFDIEESKRWSEKWQSILPKDRIVKSRIGYKKYWDEYLEEYGLEIE